MPCAHVPGVELVERDRENEAEAIPSDNRWDDQWNLRKIDWNEAYGVIDPAGSAVVAVLDTGVDASHPDLAGQVLPGRAIVEGADPAERPERPRHRHGRHRRRGDRQQRRHRRRRLRRRLGAAGHRPRR